MGKQRRPKARAQRLHLHPAHACWRRTMSCARAAHSCCIPNTDTAAATAAAHRRAVVHCAGCARCVAAAQPSKHSTQTAKEAVTRPRQGTALLHASYILEDIHKGQPLFNDINSKCKSTRHGATAHSKSPRPRAATKRNCGKTPSRASGGRPGQGGAPWSRVSDGARLGARIPSSAG